MAALAKVHTDVFEVQLADGSTQQVLVTYEVTLIRAQVDLEKRHVTYRLDSRPIRLQVLET